MSFSYSDNPAGVARDAVRLYSGDRGDIPKKSVTDAEIAFILSKYGITAPEAGSTKHRSLLLAAAEVCDILAARFSTEASYGVGGLNEGANAKAEAFSTRARNLRKQAMETNDDNPAAIPAIDVLTNSERDAIFTIDES